MGVCWPLARFVVRDTSMWPVLRPGDRLLVWRWTWLDGLRPRDLVVARDPELPGLHLVKRVAGVPDESEPGASGFLLLGDNPAFSRDSRTFGRVPGRLIVGRVVWRYLPASRRGSIRPPWS